MWRAGRRRNSSPRKTMALHINLNYERERAKLVRKRDPLKLSLFCLGLIAACFASYYFVQLAKLSGAGQDLSRKKAEFDSVDPQAKIAKKAEDDLAETMRTSETLVQRIEGRFYWAPLLEELTRVIPREVQITKLAGDVKGTGLKTCKLTLDGLSAGADPRKVAEELRTAIADLLGRKYKNVTSSLRSLEDGIEMVHLDGTAWPTATVAINVELQSGTDAAALPPPRKPKQTK